MQWDRKKVRKCYIVQVKRRKYFKEGVNNPVPLRSKIIIKKIMIEFDSMDILDGFYLCEMDS